MIYGYRRVSTKSQAKDGNSLEVILYPVKIMIQYRWIL